MTRKERASKGKSFFFEKVSFAEAFPEIDDISVEVSENPEYREVWPKAAHYDKLLLQVSGKEIKCSNRYCKGGFPIGKILRQMMVEKMREFEIEQLCNGYEVHGKGSLLKCPHMFKIKVSIAYKGDV